VDEDEEEDEDEDEEEKELAEIRAQYAAQSKRVSVVSCDNISTSQY
jgi:hypothetical protein